MLSRSSHESGDGIEFVTGDLATGQGIEAAVDGAEIILHIAGGSNAKGDEETTRNLVQAAAQPGCGTWCTSQSLGRTGSRWATSGTS